MRRSTSDIFFLSRLEKFSLTFFHFVRWSSFHTGDWELAFFSFFLFRIWPRYYSFTIIIEPDTRESEVLVHVKRAGEWVGSRVRGFVHPCVSIYALLFCLATIDVFFLSTLAERREGKMEEYRNSPRFTIRHELAASERKKKWDSTEKFQFWGEQGMETIFSGKRVSKRNYYNSNKSF